MLLWWDDVIAIFHAIWVKTYWRTNINFWFLLDPCSSSNLWHKIAKRPLEDREETVKNLLAALEYGLLFIEIYWSVGETILK